MFWVATAGGGAVPLWEGGTFFVIFGLSYPAGMFTATQVADLWLDHLPSQVRIELSFQTAPPCSPMHVEVQRTRQHQNACKPTRNTLSKFSVAHERCDADLRQSTLSIRVFSDLSAGETG